MGNGGQEMGDRWGEINRTVQTAVWDRGEGDQVV